MLVAVDGPALATNSVYVMLWPALNGPTVVSVLMTETSADGDAVPPLPMLSVLLFVFGSGSVAPTVAVLSTAPAALIVAVTLMVTLAPEARVAIVQGSAAQPPPLTFVMLRFVGVSVTWMFVAVDGPPFATNNV